MSLSNYKFAEASVTGGLTVRGLSFFDIAPLVGQFGPELTAVYENVSGNDVNLNALIGDLVGKAPPLVGAIIASGCGEPEQTETAMRLPIAIQIEALQKIGELTFATEGGAKKVFTMVIGMLNGTSALVTDLNA
jgi:hypothetical protein